jgi:hypothetical protein
MRLPKLWWKIVKETHKKTEPIYALSKAILEGSLSMANSLRPSMNFKTQEEDEKNWVYVLFEFQYLLLHLVSRFSVIQVGPEKRSDLLEDIGPLVIEPNIEAIFGHWPDDLKNKIESEYYENLAESEFEYGSCKTVMSDKDVENMNDIVMHRFGKNVARVMGAEHNLGLILDIQHTLIKGIENIHLKKLLEQVYAVL